ncbi:MAG TPA: hypothetical protein VMH81_30255 [Bryobacteraceae bacterium]|nr:hypothetical protein [Bryobacteraceae bacterium]
MRFDEESSTTSREGAAGIAEPEHPGRERVSPALEEEVSDFIRRNVLERGAQLFDG